MSAARCSGGESTASLYGAMNDAVLSRLHDRRAVIALCVAATSAATGVMATPARASSKP